MRKRKKTISKNMVEVLDYHTSRTYRKNGKRVKKKSITPDAMKKQNEKQAEAMLRMLIDNNFTTNDCYLTITYREQPATWEDAKKDIQNFIRRLKRSKNLEKPKVKTEILKPSEWRDYIQPPKGYYVETDSVVEAVSDEGYPYRFYRLIRIEEVKHGTARNRNRHRDNARNGNSFSMRN